MDLYIELTLLNDFRIGSNYEPSYFSISKTSPIELRH